LKDPCQTDIIKMLAALERLENQGIKVEIRRIESHIDSKESNPATKQKIGNWLKQHLPEFQLILKDYFVDNTIATYTSIKVKDAREFIIRGNEGADYLAKTESTQPNPRLPLSCIIMIGVHQKFAFQLKRCHCATQQRLIILINIVARMLNLLQSVRHLPEILMFT
jgi:hypothetical protein